MRQTKYLAVITGVFICAVGSAEQAQAGDVYKYVDERGATMYTDKPIPGAVLVSTGAQRPPEVAARSYAANQAATNSTLAASDQRIAAAQDTNRVAGIVAKDIEATRVERCKKARDSYQKSINSQRLYRTTADGKREYLDDAQLAQARIASAKQVEAICGPQG
jgi:hypothetical protein